jgi:tetratricopeptide (TPR) repeat protein
VLFWFHPIVWWTGSKLVYERELACDESVLQAGRNPRVYAQGILKVCEYYSKSPMACISGIIGSNLKIRMEGIMKNQIGYKLSFGKKLFLSVAGLLMLCIPVVLGTINAPPSQAYSFDNDLNNFYANEYQLDTFQISGRSERENNPSEIINKEQDQGNSRVISNTGMMFQSEYSGTNKNPEKKPGYFNAVWKSILSTDAEDSIVLTQKEATVEVSTDAGNVPKTRSDDLETEDADIYISHGVSHLKEGQIEDAINDFNKAIKLDPGKAVAYVARGSAYFRLNRLDNAISDYNSAIEIKPDLAVAYQNRGSVYYTQGKFDNAISDYNKAIEINPDFGAAYQDRGKIYQSQGRFDNAISDFSKALELNPGDALIYYFRGNAYYEQGRPDDAISDYNKAVDIYPRFAVAYHNRGSAYYSKHNYKKAISDYDKAIDLNPKSAVTYSSRGNAYFMQGKIGDAITDYNKALELNPDIDKTNDGNKMVCRRIAPLGSVIKKKVCLTNAQWASKEMGQGIPNNKSWTYEDYLFNIWLYSR